MKTLMVLCLLASGCAPGIRGSWDASGQIDQDRLFKLTMTFESPERGVALLAMADGASHPVPICRLIVVERSVRFDLDAQGGTSCTAATRPLTFRGTLGHDVVAGDIVDASGKDTGIWRAFRRPEQ